MAVSNSVEVLVEGSGRLGALSYQVPLGLRVRPGDLVRVPFGKSERRGVVLGPAAKPEKATRPVSSVVGSAIGPLEVQVAQATAVDHASTLAEVLERVPMWAADSPLTESSSRTRLIAQRHSWSLPNPPRNWLNRLYLRAPLVDPARLAAEEAIRLRVRYPGQVLILCPTSGMAEEVLSHFASGATRVGAGALAGNVRAFREGLVGVGVGTRSAAFLSPQTLAGLVVVEEEHPGHVESQMPYVHSREVAVRRAAAHGCPLTLISANPTPVGVSSKVKVLEVGTTANWPRVVFLDRGTFPPTERAAPPPLRALVTRAQASSIPVLVAVGTGSAARWCSACGARWDCKECGVAACPHPCGTCHAASTQRRGLDAARARKLFPGCSTASWERLPADGSKRLVVVPSVDSLAAASAPLPEFLVNAALQRAAAAAGPGGTVVVLSGRPDYPVLEAFKSRDAVRATRLVWALAQDRMLPPFGVRARVQVHAKRKPKIADWPGVVFGPRFVDGDWEFEVRAAVEDRSAVLEQLAAARRRGKARVRIE